MAKEKEKSVVMEKKYSIEALRKDSVKLFNVTTSTFYGAFYGKSGEYSIKAAGDIINDFQWRRLK